MSQTSYLREFCAQVSKIVFLADLTVLRLFITDEQKSRKTHVSTIFLRKCQKIVFLTVLIVLRCFDCLTAYYKLYEQKCQKILISENSVHKYQKSCSKLIWLFYCLLLLFKQKYHKTHLSASSVHKYHKSCS